MHTNINHYAVHLKIIQCYFSIISQFLKNQVKTFKQVFWAKSIVKFFSSKYYNIIKILAGFHLMFTTHLQMYESYRLQ